MEELEVCRICVTCYPLKDMDFIYIFHKNEEFQSELDFIEGEIQQWELKIKPEDGLPQRICADCFAKFCSIYAFRKECEQAQEKLLQTVIDADKQEQQQQQQQQQQHPLLAENDAAMPMMDGSGSGGADETDHKNDLVTSVSLAQNDVVLNDFRVFDQQFDHFDNPTLMDSSATLLDNNLMTTETGNEMGFLPSQNLFTFETAEPPTSGTLPLVETETPSSIMGDIMDVQSAGGDDDDEMLAKHDLEDMLRRSIIPTNTTSLTATTNQNSAKMTITRTTTVATAPNIIKTEEEGTTMTNTNLSNTSVTQTVQQPVVRREDVASDNECDDTDVNKRLKGLPYTCHYCYCPDSGPIDHLSFPNEDALSQHFFDIHDPNRPYICPHCGNSYKTQKLRDNHVRVIHENTKSQKCNFCQKTLRGAVEMHQYHCQHVGDWECDQCDQKFPNTSLYRFRLHQRQHERGKNFKCHVCERSFMRKSNLEAHEKMHKNEAKSQWHCKICNTNFLTNYDLRRHNYQQHDDESPVKCKECNQGFSSIAFLQRHVTQIHNSQSTSLTPSSPNIHICLKCNATFMCLDSLHKHMNIANGNNGQCLPPSATFDVKERRRIQRQGVFPCFLCPKRFHLRSQLDKHLNTHDARLRPFQCEQCYVRCRTAIELKQHVDVAHLNIKAFACDKCGKSFGYKKDLRDHMLFHAEVNVHCTEEGCEYVCKNEKALMDHIRHKHRLLSCEYCREEFTRQKMTSHLRNVHRAEIDVQLAGESDNFYKSKLLNNNNDITQISFNLLNTQTATTVNSTALGTLSSTLSAATITTTTSSTSSISPNPPLSPTMSMSSNIHAISSPSSSSSISSHHHMAQATQANITTSAASSISSHVFVTDHNSNNLALNGFVSSPQSELNLVSGDVVNAANTMFVVSAASTTTTTNSSATNPNHSNVDQYFMASLMDTEQEITVT